MTRPVVAETNGTKIVVTAPLTYTARMKEVPGHRFNSKTKSWSYPLTWAHCVMLRGTFGTELEVGSALRAWASEDQIRRVRPAMEARA